MDILGPLPTSARGNKYIPVIADYFTKWTEAFALRNHKANTIAKKLVEEFICRFGAPYAIHSDQGRDFESNLLKEVGALFDSKKQRTTAYHPQCDGEVERFNETFLNMLSKQVKEDQKNWDDELLFLMMAYRCSVNETTGFTPPLLMLGHELRLPIDIVFGECPQGENFQTQYVSTLRQKLNSAFQRVRTNTDTAQNRQKDYYDKKVSGKKLKVGDQVMLYNPAVKRGRSPKLHCPWEIQPYDILEKMSDVDYKFRKRNEKAKIVHFNRLTKFVPSNQGEDESGLSSEDNADRNNEDKLRKEKKTCLVKRNRNDPDPEQQIAAPGEGRERSESFGDIDDDLTDESTMLGEHHLMAEKEIGNENGNLENHANETDNESEIADDLDSDIDEEAQVSTRPRRTCRRPVYLNDFETD
jgi:hypothetical protein